MLNEIIDSADLDTFTPAKFLQFLRNSFFSIKRRIKRKLFKEGDGMIESKYRSKLMQVSRYHALQNTYSVFSDEDESERKVRPKTPTWLKKSDNVRPVYIEKSYIIVVILYIGLHFLACCSLLIVPRTLRYLCPGHQSALSFRYLDNDPGQGHLFCCTGFFLNGLDIYASF